MKQQVSQLMQTEISRKEFLGMSGSALASLFGIGPIYKLATGKSLVPARPASHGYGNSAYGK